MPSVVDVSCPNCEKTLKVPPAVFGKRVKCKHCEHAFVVQDPDAAKPSRPTKPGAKPAAKPAASPPPPPAPPKRPFDDDEEGPDKIEVISEGDDIPRCPHCAQELDPPDAIVCIHCGFNNRTREKAETKKVWAPTFEDWAKHLAPGIIALAICITLIVVNVIAFMDMREWLEGSFLEKDEKDAAGRKTYYIHPRAFNFFLLGISLPIFVPAAKYAYRRLVLEFTPKEQVKK
jgi:hypothetical protein